MLSKKDKERIEYLERELIDRTQEKKEYEVKSAELEKNIINLTERYKFVEGLLCHLLSLPTVVTDKEGRVHKGWKEAGGLRYPHERF